MARRSVIALLLVAGCLGFTPTADAQLLFRRNRMENDTNPEHEQKKTQAQSAYQSGDYPKAIGLYHSHSAPLAMRYRDSVLHVVAELAGDRVGR